MGLPAPLSGVALPVLAGPSADPHGLPPLAGEHVGPGIGDGFEGGGMMLSRGAGLAGGLEIGKSGDSSKLRFGGAISLGSAAIRLAALFGLTVTELKLVALGSAVKSDPARFASACVITLFVFN